MPIDKLRNRQLLNLMSGLICQIVTAISGLILPSLIIKTYGSVLNGLVSTITQMVAYLTLVEAGLTSASLVSLFKPMAEKDYEVASSIMSAINRFYMRVANIFAIGSILCGIGATFIIKDDIPNMTIWLVTFSVTGSSFVSFRLLNKYKVLLQADNRIYIVNVVHTLAVIVQFAFSVIFVQLKINIASTKAIIIVTCILEWFLLLCYTRKCFPSINISVPPMMDSIKQRKDIIIHQILALVLNNTDVILLATFSTSLSAVSVYTVYAMIGTLIHNILNSFISMFSAKMGQRYAVSDYAGVKAILKKYEVIYDIALFTMYGCMAVLILPFISIYTNGVTDAEYYVPIVGMLFSVYGISRMLRLPYSELTFSAGHFKDTKIQAIIEASTNLIISIILIPFYGIAGVLIGSIIGELYRTIHTYYYCHKRIIHIDWMRSTFLMIINSISVCFIMRLFRNYRYMMIDSYFSFFRVATLVFIEIFVLVGFVNYISVKLFYKLRELHVNNTR